MNIPLVLTQISRTLIHHGTTKAAPIKHQPTQILSSKAYSLSAYTPKVQPIEAHPIEAHLIEEDESWEITDTVTTFLLMAAMVLVAML